MAGHDFIQSTNAYDWLGHGIYFWEANPGRALNFAQERADQENSPVIEPEVVGAVIVLGNCLDLSSTTNFEALKASHRALVAQVEKAERSLPENSKDHRRRNLDCAVIELLHRIGAEAGETAYDTVRSPFMEGHEIYDGSGFRDETHIQICVRNTESVIGVFRVSEGFY